MKILNITTKGFTLLETLASISMLSLIIIGPLSVTIGSSGYARLTKDTIVATYLAEEAIELLQNQYDSLYIYCKKYASSTLPGGYCATTGTPETTTGQTAWRLFKNKLSSSAASGAPLLGGKTCYLPKGSSPGYSTDSTLNIHGCSFDYIHMQATSTQESSKHDASTSNCKYLMPVATSTTITVASTTGWSAYMGGASGLFNHNYFNNNNIISIEYKNITATSTNYVCSGEPTHKVSGGKIQPKEYTRFLTVEHIPTFEGASPSNEQFNDDLRITSSVKFKALNGTSQVIKVTRFMHARP